jgi:hypothetical protein
VALITRTTAVGLVLAEHAQDEAAVARALRQIDDKLCLQKHPGQISGGWVYKVFRAWSDDHPADLICTWADEYGNPLPLTMGLVDLVNRLRLDAPNRGVDADAHNEAHLAGIRKLGRDLEQAVIDDHRAKVERGRVSVSMGVTNRKPEWVKKNRGLIAR